MLYKSYHSVKANWRYAHEVGARSSSSVNSQHSHKVILAKQASNPALENFKSLDIFTKCFSQEQKRLLF